MAISLKHKFVSVKGDGSDATLLRPSNWNDEHDILMGTNKIIGRMTAGTGAAEELPVTQYMMDLLNTVDFATLATLLGLPTTGDAKLTFKATADSGWIMMNDSSIGNVGSGAGYSNASAQALFILFYGNVTDANAPLQTSAGSATTRAAQGAAATAWGNGCRMVLPKQLGRAIIVGGAGAGLTSRLLGAVGGEENHTITAAEVPDHAHTTTVTGAATGSATGAATGAATGTATGSAAGTGTGTGAGTASGSGTAVGSYSGTTSGHSVDHAHYTSGTTSTVSNDHTHGFSGTTQSMNRSNPHSHAPPAMGYAQAGIDNGGQICGNNGAFGSPAGIAYAATDINHEHGFSGNTGGISANHTHTWGAWSGGVNTDHSHTFSGSVNSTVTISSMPVTVSSLSVAVNIPSHSLAVSIPAANLSVNIPALSLSVNATGTSGGAGYGGGAHNNMQPFTAWNVMVKL